ncbi:MAG: cupin domain-containing protein [Candidatus Marinimicrobia bacterium]|nr:cupin domain-containing protein [Candidatus Neomarinimicrobiota bacterium]MCH8068316.1 cupin domain-containing protein [Candidatus Neomarinimicrobiota bacterium]
MEINIRKPTKDEIEEMKQNPIWECEPSEFPWHYSLTETCYLLAGKVIVKTDEGDVEFGAGDLVTFPVGLSCTWKVIEKVRKHYTFGD